MAQDAYEMMALVCLALMLFWLPKNHPHPCLSHPFFLNFLICWWASNLLMSFNLLAVYDILSLSSLHLAQCPSK